MSAERWNSAGLQEMVSIAPAGLSPRKFNLFTNWCCQVLRPYLKDRRSIAAAQFADRHVDDRIENASEAQVHLEESRAAVTDLESWAKASPTCAVWRRRRVYVLAAQVAQQAVGDDLPNGGVLSSSKYTAHALGWANANSANGFDHDAERIRDSQIRLQEGIFREIVGNPFLPIEFDPRWRTDDVMGIARGIYANRAFTHMPILSDALMDAGCDDEHIIGHCRGKNQHVRGCWLIDLILQQN